MQIKDIESKTIIIDKKSGEVLKSLPPNFNQEPGRYRVQQDFSECPSQTDQSQIHENNINELMKKYKPDELAAYLTAKNSYKKEINNHDFSQEPSLMQAMNKAKEIQDEFEKLPQGIQLLFKGKPAEFLKYADDPKNRPQLEKWGLAQKSKEMLEALNVRSARDEAERARKQKEQEALDKLVNEKKS